MTSDIQIIPEKTVREKLYWKVFWLKEEEKELKDKLIDARINHRMLHSMRGDVLKANHHYYS